MISSGVPPPGRPATRRASSGSITVPRLFLIDGSSQMYRAFHAIRGLTGPDGRSTNAVYGFVTMLRKLLADHHPEFIAAAFDLPGPTFRRELAADYKANRAPMPADLAEQVPLVHQACEALGVPVLTEERYEADDVIGTLARRAAGAGFDVAIVTGDKDFFQLVGGAIRVFNPRDDGTWYDDAGVLERFGVLPDRVVDVLALTGDTIDNVKGVPGIGEKGARDLIASHGSLDALLRRAADVPNRKYREALLAHVEDARQSRELVRIQTDVPVEVPLESLKYRGASRERCFALFSALGFRSLVMEYAPTAESVGRDYRVVVAGAELEGLVAELRQAGRFALHVLTDTPVAMRGRIVGLAFASAPRRARYLAVGHRTLDGATDLDLPAALAALRPLFEDPDLGKVGHDLKAAMVALAGHGIGLAGLESDTMLASYLLDATRSAHPIEDCALEYLTYKALTEEDVCGRGAKAVGFADLPVDAARDFAAERADLALQLAAALEPRLDEAGLRSVYREMEMPLVPVLADIERVGVRIDQGVLAAQSQRIERELSDLGARIFELAGGEFNINSPKQLSEILFDRLQLPSLKKTGKTRTASTAVEVLEELALAHDLPRLVLEWRALQKLKGTYIDALPELVNPATGRVHTSFNQAVAATGRLSSSDPNLQNVPIRTELGREIRRAFVALPGHRLISADYSQIELRVLAHLSGDETLIDAFRRGDDIHDQTALKVFGPASGLDRHELRRRAKIVNYALLYGKTAFTLAKDIGVPQAAAQAFIDAYFAGFPRVREFIDRTIAAARATGEVRTMFGRRRLVPELSSRNGQIRAAAERVTVNMPIQGTAADILKRAMIDLHAVLEDRARNRPAARMILTVHDELLFEVPEAHADETAALVRERMERAADLAVPLTVDVGIGANWMDAKG
jgi:DNA polymerase-1